jgi:succinyl-CoA synthetase beta subunit
MRFYEFEAKQLLKKHRIPLVQSELANTADEAEKIASDIGGPVILKPQAIAPGVAAASAKEVADPAGAKAVAAELLGLDDGGRKPNGILVEARPTGEAVYSLSFTYDGTTKRPVVAASDMAGKIDDIGDTHPDRIVRRHFSALYPFSDYIAKELAKSLGLGGNDLKRMTRIAKPAIGRGRCSTSSVSRRMTFGRCVNPRNSSSRARESTRKIFAASSARSLNSMGTSGWSSAPVAARSR